MAARISPHVEPATRRFLEEANAAGGRPIQELALEEARHNLRALQKGAGVARLTADITKHTAKTGPQGEIRFHIVRPIGSQEPLPAIVYFHGGGWVVGGADTHERLARDLADGASAAVVLVEYSLAPEARYPVQIEEAYAATR